MPYEYEIAEKIYDLSQERVLYIYHEPDILDFTKDTEGKLYFCTKDEKTELPLNRDSIYDLCSALEINLFTKDLPIITWDIKELVTFAKYYTNSLINIGSSIFDLKVIESYLDIQKPRPNSFAEAAIRFRHTKVDMSWYKIYKNVYHPLITKVIPDIESIPLIDTNIKSSVYSHYEINGQANGRSKCKSAYAKSYNPHIMDEETKLHLKPYGYGGKIFMYLDYKQMEVNVLSWLCKDEELQKIIDNGDDFYISLSKLLKTPTISNRESCKLLFLPVIYGESAPSIANKFDISILEADDLISLLGKIFPKCFTWLKNQEESINTTGVVRDFFGRPRHLDSSYKARNFSVQSPASIFCLEKLIKLHDALQDVPDASVVFHIHDGYGIVCTNKNYEKIFQIAKEALESDSQLMSGLTIKVTGKIGPNLQKMAAVRFTNKELNARYNK